MAKEDESVLKDVFTAPVKGGGGDVVSALAKFVMNDPALAAAFRLGGKELGQAFVLGHEGSISQGAEMGTLFSATPGSVDRQEGNVWGMDSNEHSRGR
jgi:hypothetical protein